MYSLNHNTNWHFTRFKINLSWHILTVDIKTEKKKIIGNSFHYFPYITSHLHLYTKVLQNCIYRDKKKKQIIPTFLSRIIIIYATKYAQSKENCKVLQSQLCTVFFMYTFYKKRFVCEKKRRKKKNSFPRCYN